MALLFLLLIEHYKAGRKQLLPLPTGTEKVL